MPLGENIVCVKYVRLNEYVKVTINFNNQRNNDIDKMLRMRRYSLTFTH